MKTRIEVWNAYRIAVEKFQIVTANPNTTILESTKARHEVESLEREWDAISLKEAA
jgi:hypothetical protein